jgi:tRNA U34 5-methylaminomethyl-2-thiouridine-forming methyltransferase MnmC
MRRQVQSLMADAFHVSLVDTLAQVREMQLVSPVLLDHASESFEIVTVQSGDRSLRSLEFGETFHPVVGPMAEAVGLHVRQQRLLERAARVGGRFVIWDVGLGAAANAVAAIEAFASAPGAGINVDLHSFDLSGDALHFALGHAAALGYLALHVSAAQALLKTRFSRRENLDWTFHPGDFRETMSVAPAPHAIFYDPYSPQSNPGMWSLDHFTRLRARLSPEAPCLLTNYTRSTAVRVTLLLAGFYVGRGHATGEKDQTTIATNEPALLEAALDLDWLGRVRRSTKSAPLRENRVGWEGISPEDWAKLESHPQFAG